MDESNIIKAVMTPLVIWLTSGWAKWLGNWLGVEISVLWTEWQKLKTDQTVSRKLALIGQSGDLMDKGHIDIVDHAKFKDGCLEDIRHRCQRFTSVRVERPTPRRRKRRRT